MAAQILGSPDSRELALRVAKAGAAAAGDIQAPGAVVSGRQGAREDADQLIQGGLIRRGRAGFGQSPRARLRLPQHGEPPPDAKAARAAAADAAADDE